MNNFKKSLCAAAAAAMLSACGGSDGVRIVVPVEPPATRVDLLASSERGMQSIAFDDRNAYVSLSNSATQPSSVMRTSASIRGDSVWNAVIMGGCGLPPATADGTQRAGKLASLTGKTFLYQPSYEETEHALCELNGAGTSFVPKDQGLRSCFGAANEYCSILWMDDLKAVGNRLYSNAGAGPNLLVSENGGSNWRVILGQFDSMICTHQSFHIVGTRLIVGGECPLDSAYVRAYQLAADGVSLASQTPLAVQVPELENRNVQFIESVPGTQRVFIGVEGGLLRSEDGGQSFKFVIQHPLSGGNYPYVGHFLSVANKPNVIVIAGFDKANGKPYLAWSDTSGDKWTDLSSLLPGYQSTNRDATAQVTSLVQDGQGRILLTMNEDLERKGKLFLLSLGKP